jgi:hypothetical protein
MKHAMLSVVLLAYDPPRAAAVPAALRRQRIARSLASLVEACVQGLVADAVLAGPLGAGLGAVADEAGCVLIESADRGAGLALALRAARHADIFMLRAGYAVERGFVDEARDALALDGLERARVLRAAPESFATRIAPNFAEPVGLLARKAALLGAGAGDVASLARRLRGAELATSARKTG